MPKEDVVAVIAMRWQLIAEMLMTCMIQIQTKTAQMPQSCYTGKRKLSLLI